MNRELFFKNNFFGSVAVTLGPYEKQMCGSCGGHLADVPKCRAVCLICLWCSNFKSQLNWCEKSCLQFFVSEIAGFDAAFASLKLALSALCPCDQVSLLDFSSRLVLWTILFFLSNATMLRRIVAKRAVCPVGRPGQQHCIQLKKISNNSMYKQQHIDIGIIGIYS